MTLRLSPDYPLLDAFDRHHVNWISEEAAERQDFRPLYIGILNIMPKAQEYEYNLLAPMGRSILQIVPIWIRLVTHAYKSTDHAHLDRHYLPFDWAQTVAALDGLIITGAPVENKAWDDITYWPELSRIIDVAHQNGTLLLGICWGALALAKHLGLEKTVYPRKVFGLYETHNLDVTHVHPIMSGLDDVFLCPQSRFSGIADATLEQAAREGKVRLLAHAPEVGYVIFDTPDGQLTMHLGHQEYNSGRILAEARRDAARPDVPPPVHFNPDTPNPWRANRTVFFSGWIKHVYLTTPYQKPAGTPRAIGNECPVPPADDLPPTGDLPS
ncbi:MAG: homoserine O-succinyltransferase [Kiritimatiellae bacterium]|nr:homoserine O-succinyltransferase [Kiritimatiellia bacterium]